VARGPKAEGRSIETPGRMASWRRRGAGTWLLAVAGAAAVYAVLISWAGGFDIQAGPMRLRSRDAFRPAAIAAVAFILFLVVDHRRARRGLASAWTVLESPLMSRALLAVALVWTAVAGVMFNTRAAGGSDSYGYVSQVALLRGGDLVDRVAFDPAFTWRDAPRTLVPYGYVPTDAAELIAPQYPPGLSLLMLPASLAAADAIYFVVPVFGLLLVAAVWIAGRRIADPLVAGIAAVLLSVSPTFLYQVVQPMSDVPAAALWLAAILAVRQGRLGDLVSGLCIGVAILVRPNLAPLAAVVFFTGWRVAPWTVREATRFVAPIAAGVGLLLYVQLVRYGSPLASGYGRTADLFGMEFVATNLRQYPGWLTMTHGPTIWLAAGAPLVLRRGHGRTFAMGMLALAASVWILYIPYVSFQPHEWHYTRFLLPAIAIMLLLSAVVLLRAVRLLLPEARTVVTVAALIALVFVMGRAAIDNGALHIHDAEQKYPVVGAAVIQRVGPRAWVLAGQHSGSLRHYAASHTVRWDLVAPGDLDRVLDILRARGARPIVVLDPGEVDAFRERFRTSRAVASMTLLETAHETRLYALE
jgi:hypothetical protein